MYPARNNHNPTHLGTHVLFTPHTPFLFLQLPIELYNFIPKQFNMFSYSFVHFCKSDMHLVNPT